MYEWLVCDMACMIHGITIAPLYDTLGPDTIKIVLEETNAQTLCLTENHIEEICKIKTAGGLPYLKNLVLLDCETSESATSAGFETYSFTEVCKIGSEN